MVCRPLSEVGIVYLGHCHPNTDLQLLGPEIICTWDNLLKHICLVLIFSLFITNLTEKKKKTTIKRTEQNCVKAHLEAGPELFKMQPWKTEHLWFYISGMMQVFSTFKFQLVQAVLLLNSNRFADVSISKVMGIAFLSFKRLRFRANQIVNESSLLIL